MVFNPAGKPGKGEELVLANPRIIRASRRRELGEEGCLSFLKLGTTDLILADVEVPPRMRRCAEVVSAHRAVSSAS